MFVDRGGMDVSNSDQWFSYCSSWFRGCVPHLFHFLPFLSSPWSWVIRGTQYWTFCPGGYSSRSFQHCNLQPGKHCLLSLLLTRIENLCLKVLFRNNFALSRDITGLFQSFQSSSTVLDPAANPSLFRSTLVIIIKVCDWSACPTWKFPTHRQLGCGRFR